MFKLQLLLTGICLVVVLLTAVFLPVFNKIPFGHENKK
jgi:hypothetical protein